ncbi:MAG: PTS glucose transporter subunit IIA [Mycoplasmataceae bacterium]|jgi:PTS system beta-glucosides-specific IIC component|nr:PTS glucose transporter subunit IIA [Mycoplasmataceae bacterium]
MGFFSKLFGKKNKESAGEQSLYICSPADGEVVSTSEVKDETFSQNMIGKGFALKPSSGEFVSPIDGELTLVAETGHAFSIKHANGIEILVHIGIDTVNMNANRDTNTPLKGFKLFAKAGDKVNVGAPIITADLDAIKKAGYDTITPVIVVNNEFSTNKTIADILKGQVTKTTKILEIK